MKNDVSMNLMERLLEAENALKRCYGWAGGMDYAVARAYLVKYDLLDSHIRESGTKSQKSSPPKSLGTDQA